MAKTIGEVQKHPAGKNADYDILPWALAKGIEQEETHEIVEDEKAKKAKAEVSPYSDKLRKGLTIKVEDNDISLDR